MNSSGCNKCRVSDVPSCLGARVRYNAINYDAADINASNLRRLRLRATTKDLRDNVEESTLRTRVDFVSEWSINASEELRNLTLFLLQGSHTIKK
jgi:hypothetical protein